MEYADDAAAQAAYPTSDGYNKEESSETSDDQYGLRPSSTYEKLAQGFQLSAAIKLNKISLELVKLGTIAAGKYIWLYIYDDSGGDPNNAISVQSIKIEANTISTSPTWYDFTLSTQLSLAATTQYHIVLEGDYVYSGTNLVRWRLDLGNPYANGIVKNWNEAAWIDSASYDFAFKLYDTHFQCFSEFSLKQQGSYSLKGFAKQADGLNDTLTRTVGPTINLSGLDTIKFDIRASRTGANIKVGIHDSGGTTTEKTYTVLSADTWETVTWDISGVADADKNAIDQIIVTILNADADNTFYLDNMYAEEAEEGGDAIFFGMNF